ncbi:MAG: transaldolase family protein, partial [Candidatus Eiseniibacteriota bacterium]
MTTRAKLANPLKLLREQGQSVWLDYIRRDLTTSGELERLIEQDGLSGITSNPAIFEKAIGGSDLYAADLAELGAAKHLDAESVFERLAIEDIQRAATLLGGVHEATGGRDGFVSMEVSPRLAHDTQATIDAARRLWKAIDRPNLMIKVPATPAGLPAVEQLIGDGIHINVTLLFAVDTYAQVVDAYMAGLEHLAAQGGDV